MNRSSAALWFFEAVEKEKHQIWTWGNASAWTWSPAPHLNSFPAVGDVTYASSSSPLPTSSAAPHRIAPASPKPGGSPHLRDGFILRTTFLRRSLRTPAGLLVVPALKEAVEGQDGQGAQDVHDPSPQVHLSGTAQTEARSWWMFSSIVPESIQACRVCVPLCFSTSPVSPLSSIPPRHGRRDVSTELIKTCEPCPVLCAIVVTSTFTWRVTRGSRRSLQFLSETQDALKFNPLESQSLISDVFKGGHTTETNMIKGGGNLFN